VFVRLIDFDDFDEVVAMARTNMEQTRPTLTFNEQRCRDTLESSVAIASPTIYVVEEKRKLIGFLVMDFFSHQAADGLYAVQQVLFVKPEKRGTRAATLLMRQLIEWAARIGCNEIIGGNDNEFNSERTAKFLEHFGFKKVGFAMRREL
jgi:L-amino acid N-acyltransferase YncA